MKKGLYALSFGTFGLGIAEFIMMSILPDVAAGFDISLSEAGHLISAYALGVCVGAPLVVRGQEFEASLGNTVKPCLY